VRRFIARFALQLEARAKDREREGNPFAAGAFRCAAKDLVTDFEAFMGQELTYVQGAIESGYDAESLRKLAAQGQWSRTRGDLPRRPRRVGERAPRPVATAGARR